MPPLSSENSPSLWEIIVRFFCPSCADRHFKKAASSDLPTPDPVIAKSAIDSKEALAQNMKRGQELAKKGEISQHVQFFKDGMSDESVPIGVPAADIKQIVGNIGKVYVVGKPAPGKDLDIIVVGEVAPEFSDYQHAALNVVAQTSGFTDVHVQLMTYQEAAGLRFATQPTTPLHVIPNTRNPMMWRLIP